MSHSSRERYETCSEKYRLHDIERYRGLKIASALFFGNALDEAFSRLLLDKKKLKTPEELEQVAYTPEQIFDKHMQSVKHVTGEPIDVPHSTLVDYYNSDFDESLLTPKHIKQLEQANPDIPNFPAFMKACQELKKQRKKLDEEDYKLYNYVTWLTLVEKGYMMIDAYRYQIMPQIFEVFDIQKKITITNATGDKIGGKIDFKCSFSDDPLQVYTVDNKTSATPYTQADLDTSDQLATYCEHEGDYHAAYIVVEKKVRKKVPRIRANIVKGVISEQNVQKTFDKFEETMYSIEQKKFVKNESACFSYGRMCEFYAICKHNSYSSVIKLDKK